MPDSELASRLKSARESVGLSLTEAAKRLGFINYQTLSTIENAGREVKVSELAKFARVYFRDISYFLEEHTTEPVYSFLWRNPPVKNEKRKETEGKIFLKCEQYNLLEKLLNLSIDRGFVDASKEDIRNNHQIGSLALRTSDMLKLGSRPSFTLQKVLEQDYGVKILFLPLEYGSAVCTVHPQCGKAIVINSKEAPWRRNYDMAHELFHLILWKVFPPRELADEKLFAEMEKKAEKFASMLLLPENEVVEETARFLESNKKITYSDLVDIAMDFGVSTRALLYRYAYLQYLDWGKADEIAKDEELAELSRERRYVGKDRATSNRFITLAVRCLRKGLLSRGKFAEIVEIDRSDIDNFIENKGMMESEGKRIEIMAS